MFTIDRKELAKVQMASIQIVDNYRSFQWIVREFLNLGPDIEVLGDVVNGEEAIREVKAFKPNAGLNLTLK